MKKLYDILSHTTSGLAVKAWLMARSCVGAVLVERVVSLRSPLFLFLLIYSLGISAVPLAVGQTEPSQDRRPVVLGPLKDLAELEVKKSCLGTKPKAGKVHTKTLTFRVKPAECFIYPAPKGFEYLAVQELHPLNKSGEPQLPTKTFLVELDKNAEVYGLEVVAGRFAKVQGEINLAPSPRAKEPGWNKLFPDKEVYALTTPFPGKLVRYDLGCDNERQYVFVRLYPLQYVPTKKEAILVTQATLRLYYRPGTHSPQEAGGSLFGALPGIKSPVMAPTAKNVIICPRLLQDQAQQLARFHSRKEGIWSVVMTTEAIQAAYLPVEDPPFDGWKNLELGGEKVVTGYDYTLARQIIAYLRDHASHPQLASITLLGDATLVPPSYYYYDYAQAHLDYDKWVPSDLFYSSPDYDLVPNYHLGRLSVRTPTEALHVVEKIERWYAQAKAEWFKKIYLVNAWKAKRYDCLRKGFFDGFQVSRLDTDDERVEKIHVEPAFTTAEAGFMFFGLHGSGSSMSLESTQITVDDLMSYEAHDKLPLVFAVTCRNGAYDLGLVKWPWAATDLSADKQPTIRSFGEGVLLSKAGGIAYFGVTRIGTDVKSDYFHKGDLVTTHFKYAGALLSGYSLLAYRNGAKTIGELNSKALFAYLTDNDISGDPVHLLELFQHVLLGDPALKIPRW